MKKKTIAISTIATAILAGGSIAYVQNTPKTDTTSETEKVAQHISLNYKLSSFTLNMIAELLTKLYQQDEDTKDFIYQKQEELASLIRQIEENDLSSKDDFLKENKKNQVALANTTKEILSTALAYHELNSQENRDKLAKVTASVKDSMNTLLSIEKKAKENYNIEISYSGTIDSKDDSEVHGDLKNVKDIDSKKVTISYKEGTKNHKIEIN